MSALFFSMSVAMVWRNRLHADVGIIDVFGRLWAAIIQRGLAE